MESRIRQPLLAKLDHEFGETRCIRWPRVQRLWPVLFYSVQCRRVWWDLLRALATRAAARACTSPLNPVQDIRGLSRVRDGERDMSEGERDMSALWRYRGCPEALCLPPPPPISSMFINPNSSEGITACCKIRYSLLLLQDALNTFLQEFQLYALIGQWDDALAKSLTALEWVFLPHTFSKPVTTTIEMLPRLFFQGRLCCQQLSGMDPSHIHVPIKKDDLDPRLSQFDMSLQKIFVLYMIS